MSGSNSGTFWTPTGRVLVFLLASSSIACLLVDFYGLCPMGVFAPFIFLPACVGLLIWGVLDHCFGDGRLAKAVLVGVIAGLGAAVTYDVFRLPFVYAKPLGIASVVPPMNLFKVFPGFGAMILGEPVEQNTYSATARWLGWAYHFSNGASFGVMYLAMVGDGRRRHWCWAVVMAVALELGMLLTPYPQVFHIPVTSQFVVVTAAAHGLFGVALGLGARRLAHWLGTPSSERVPSPA